VIYWLIEDDDAKWYATDGTGEQWTRDAHCALRFADKRSASAIIELMALTAVPTEHQDVTP
jgi:hypothetical protein